MPPGLYLFVLSLCIALGLFGFHLRQLQFLFLLGSKVTLQLQAHSPPYNSHLSEIKSEDLFSLSHFFFSFLAAPSGLQDLSSRPGIEPGPPAVKELSPNQWTARELRGSFLMVLAKVLGAKFD